MRPGQASLHFHRHASPTPALLSSLHSQCPTKTRPNLPRSGLVRLPQSLKSVPARATRCHLESALTRHSKAYSEYFDPCQEAADKSIRCLKRNGGDRQMCSDFFQYVITVVDMLQESSNRANNCINRSYRDCKEQWVSSMPNMF
jgi:hypothetical protein